MTVSSTPLPVSIAVSDRVLRQQSHLALQSFLPAAISAQDIAATGPELIGAITASHPAVLIADLAALGEGFGETIRRLRAQPAPPDILVLHHSPDGGAILKAMRAGAREFFFEEVEESLREAIGAIASEGSPEADGKLYAFMAAKGGCGATTLASYSAASLAKIPKSKILFADLNWASPSAAFFLRAAPQYSLQDAASKMTRMDSALWNAMVTDTPHGFALAPPPMGNANPGDSTPGSVSALLSFCKSQYGGVVADCGDGVHQLTPAVVDAADEIVLVTSTDVLALHHAKRQLRAIQAMSPQASVRIVINRVRRRSEMGMGDWESMLGHPVFACVPNDYRSLTQASEQGALLAPEHPVALSISNFARKLAGSAPALKQKRKLFGLIGN